MKHKLEELSIEITYKCPMNCIHCSSRAGMNDDTMIPTGKIIEIINRCKEYCGTTNVSLSGGEPFEHPDFWKILEYIKKSGLTSIIYTCGIESLLLSEIRKPEGKEYKQLYIPFTDERINKLKGICDKLIVSLYGLQDIHNKIMDTEDAFIYTLETIRKAIRAGIVVEIHFVPTKINFRQLPMVYGVCNSLFVSKMSILRYVPQGRGLEISEKDGEINLNKKEFYELQKMMHYIKEITKKDESLTRFRVGIPADFTFLIDFIDYGDLDAKKERACTGGKTKILVKADGLVQVCPAWKELDHLSAGNIYQEDIVDIWDHGNTYCKLREFLHKDLPEPCKSCYFVSSCIGGCAAQRILASTMQIDGLKTAPDPLCFYPENDYILKFLEEDDDEY
jgi:radical SAM protein with 4Fe4S-binding SPASM domain